MLAPFTVGLWRERWEEAELTARPVSRSSNPARFSSAFEPLPAPHFRLSKKLRRTPLEGCHLVRVFMTSSGAAGLLG